jgi:SAM-dependent methyltransferase
LTFVEGDLSEFETVGGPYDLIISIDVLEHIADDTRVLRMFRRALKPHGALILHLPLRHQEQRRIFSAFKRHLVSDHKREEYTPVEIQTKIEKAGFRLQSLRYGFGWQGELAFELNTLVWTVPPIRAALALLTYPLAWWLAYWDVCTVHSQGNSLIVVAQLTEE